jgi:hypothetical protein
MCLILVTIQHRDLARVAFSRWEKVPDRADEGDIKQHRKPVHISEPSRHQIAIKSHFTFIKKS